MIYEIIKGLGNLSDIFEAGENIFKTISAQINKRKIKNAVYIKFIDLCENGNLSNNDMKDILHLFSYNEKIQNKNVFIQLNTYNSNDFLYNAKSKLSSQLYTKFKKIWNELQKFDLEKNYESQPDYIKYLARMLNYQKEELIEYFGKNDSGTYIPNSKSISLKDLELEKCPHCGHSSPLEYVLEEKSDGLKIIRAFCKFCGRSFVKLDYQFLVQASNSTIDEDQLINIFEQEIEKYNSEILKVINDRTKETNDKIKELDDKIVGLDKDLNEILKQMPDIIKKQFNDKDSRTIDNCYQLIKTEFEQSLPNKSFIETQCKNILQIDSNNIKANFFKVFINRKTNPTSYEGFLKLLTQKSLSLEELNDITPFIIKNCTYRTKDSVIKFLKEKKIYDFEKAKEIEESLNQRDKELDWFADVERDVFICYSSNDRSKATFIVEELEKEGYSCWIDYRNMEHPQDNYYEKINANLQLCKVFVFISSISSIRSTECHNEIRIASACEKPMIEYLISQDENNYRPQVLKTHFKDEWIDACQTDKVDELTSKIEKKLFNIEEQNITKPLQNKKEGSTSNETIIKPVKEVISVLHDHDKKIIEKIEQLENVEQVVNNYSEDKSIEKSNEVSSKILRTTENESIDELEFILNEDKKSYSVAKSKKDVDRVTIPSTYNKLPVTKIGDQAFENCSSLTCIEIPNSVTRMGYRVFYNCRSLKSIVISNKVTRISHQAFTCCGSLTSIEIPKRVTEIGSDAFLNCCSLTSLVIPKSVTSIGGCAFYNCYRLVEVYNLSNLDITTGSFNKGWIGHYAKVIHSSLKEESRLIEKDNYVFIKDKNNKYYLVSYKGTDTELVLPNDIEGNNYEIIQCAFYNCCSLASIVIPNGIMRIDLHTFTDCGSLTSIVIPNSVKIIGAFAFTGCSSLTSIVIPNSVKIIGAFAFTGCSSLTSIVIPDSVNSIGEDAFYYCDLKEVYYKGTYIKWNNIDIDGNRSSNLGSNNYELTSATLYYYSETKPTSDGNYWHYVNNEIVKWS